MRREKDLEKNKKAIEVQKEMIRKREIVLDLSRELLQLKTKSGGVRRTRNQLGRLYTEESSIHV